MSEQQESSTILDNPVLLSALEALAAVAVKPIKNQGPYYTEKYALWARDILDKLHADKLPVKVTAENAAIQTERLRYYQGSAYLIERLDPTGKYRELKEQTRCQDFSDFLLFTARKKRKVSVPTVVTTDDWKTKLDDFIDNAIHGEKFARPNILLAQSELDYIASRLVGVETLFQNLSNTGRILVIRFDCNML